MKRRSLLVAHPWMGRGGSEATAVWTVQALQEEFDLSFATASPVDWHALNAAYGSAVDPDRVRDIRAPRLPTVDGPARLAHAQGRYFERFCRRLAPRFDLCVSAYNPIDFGRPGVQLIGDFSFSESMRKRLYVHGDIRFRHRETPLRRAYLSLARRLGGRRAPLRVRGDRVLANSAWSADQLERHFGLPGAPVIHPPVVLPEAPPEVRRDPLGFVCLGRVVPEKEIERIVRILEVVRARGHPVTLTLIGQLDDTPYARRVAARVADLPWIETVGFLSLETKQQRVASHAWAIHACRIEAFGIAVAEMAALGCVPFVPSTGGAGEIVDAPDLQFADETEAVEKIVARLEDPGGAEAARRRIGPMNRFGPDIFVRELRKHVLDFAGDGEVAVDGVVEESGAACR